MNIFKWLFNLDWFTFAFGGGGGGPNTTYSNTSNIPEYAQPYVDRMMQATEKQVYTTDASGKPTGFQPYKPYQGETVAGFSPMQAQAMQGIQNYQLPGQTGQASNLAGLTAFNAMQAGQGYNPQAFGNYYNAPNSYQPGQFGVGDVSADRLQQYQMGAADRVSGPESFSPEMAKEYINPYMQNVVDIQKREAQRQADLASSQRAGQAAQVGAFGGSRMGLENAMANRETQRLMSDIQATGSSAAYQQGLQAAQQQFNQQQQGNMQAALANQAAGMNVGQQNLAARLGVQQLGSQQSMQAQLANQAAAQQAQQMQEASRQYGYGQNMNAAQLAAQYGLAGQQAGEQSRQFGANLAMQGYGLAGQQAALLGQLGQQQYGQEMGLLGQQQAVGAQQQQYEQSRLNQLIQNYATQQQYPFIQLGTLSNMLRGLPMQASTTQMYQAQPSAFSQMAGMAGTGLGLYQQYQKAFPGGKEGGVVKMANGGITNPYKLSGIAKKLSDPQLAEETKDDPMGVMEAETLRRKELRGMARGGIIAFKEGKEVEDDEKNKNPVLAGIKNVSPVREITDAEKDAQRKYVEAESKRKLAREDLRDMNQEIRTAAGNVSPVPKGIAPVIPTEDKGIAVAPQGPSYRDVEAANLEAGLSASGIKPETKTNPLAELETTTNEEMIRQKALRDESKGDKVKRYQKEREEANLPDPANKEREALEARKTRGEKSEQETARNNLIRFLTRWGTIPGSTMRGMIGAGAELIDKMDLDAKHRDKFLNDLDDIESKINSSEYARRLGDEGRAREEQQKAGELYFKLGHDLRTAKVNYAIKEMDTASKYEIAALKAEVAASKQQNKTAVIQMADKLMEGYIAKGEPANAITYNKALENAAKMLPGVQAAGIAAGPASINAETNITKAKTDADEAAIKAKKDARDAVIALDKAVRAKTMTDETISRDIDAANRKDKTGKAAKEIIDRVRKELAPEYGVPLSAPAPAPAAAPVKAAEPKKAEPKKAEPKKEEGKPPAAAKPKLVWDPATGTWK